jgi:hypothetical protein
MEFVAIDKSSKDEHSLAQGYGHSHLGQWAELPDPFVHDEHYSLVAAIITQGYIVMNHAWFTQCF